MRVAPVCQSIHDGAALAQFAEDDLPAKRLLHVLVELKEPNLDRLHRNVEGGVLGRRGGEWGRECRRRGRGGTAERGRCGGDRGLDARGNLVPSEDLGGDAGVEHGEVGVGRAGALEKLQHVGDSILGDGKNRVEALELHVGRVLRVDDAEALESGVGERVAAVLGRHRYADPEGILAVRVGALGAVGRDGVGGREEAIVHGHALRERDLGELHRVHRVHGVDGDKVPDGLDVRQVELDRLLTGKRVDEGKLRLNGLREFEFRLQRHVSRHVTHVVVEVGRGLEVEGLWGHLELELWGCGPARCGRPVG